MKKFEFTVTEDVGIHARPASILVKEASKYKSTIMIDRDGKTADVKRMMALMALGVKFQETVTFTVEGEDETEAAEALEKFCKENL